MIDLVPIISVFRVRIRTNSNIFWDISKQNPMSNKAELLTFCRYAKRFAQYERSRAAAEVDGEESAENPPDVVFEGGYHIPGDLYGRLFDYQKTGGRLCI